MKIEERDDKTLIFPPRDAGFVYVGQKAIDIAKRRGVPSHFHFKGQVVVVDGSEKVTQVYSDFLKHYKPLTANAPINDLLKLQRTEEDKADGYEIQNDQGSDQT